MFNIDVDTGGTMTDGLVSGNGRVHSLKVETTPHDVTISFINILDAARERLDYPDLRSLLADVDVIRWSSTITSNVLAQRTGPKLGLLVSAGHEKDLYDPEAAASVVGSLIEPDDITGIEADADESTVRAAIKSLLDRGIRRINVSLKDSFPDPSAEQRIIRMITAEYPDHFLGSIPALAGSDVVLRPYDETRTLASLINAYVHPALATTLYRAEEIVRDEHGWAGNVLIGHINGGVARIGKTKAFDTIESGPLFGTHACAEIATRSGEDKVIAIDVGGTTAKASAVVDGQVVSRESGDFFDIPLRLDLPVLRSIALGGGSVAKVEDGAVILGPESMGAAPGPACYGLGGRKATITDAFVAAGFVSPTAFLGGKRTLDVEKAKAALEKHVGRALGVGAEEAAQAVIAQAWDDVAQLARETAEEVGWDPAGCTVYGYGGNGPLFVTKVAERLGATSARYFRFGSVLSAYGSAISDVVHVYESAIVPDADLDEVGGELLEAAKRDLHGEGFDPQNATFAWEPRNASGTGYGEGGRPSDALDGLEGKPRLLTLTATYPLPSLTLPDATGAKGGPSGSRPSPFGTDGALDVYEESAVVEQKIDGPVLVDGGSYTWLVTDGWSLTSDSRGDAALTHKGA